MCFAISNFGKCEFTGIGTPCSSGGTCTISGNQTGPVTNDSTGNGATLTINQGATLTGQVDNQGKLTIENSGTIIESSNSAILSKSQSANSPITINITNKKDGKIEGSGGIEIGKEKTTATSGTITLKNEGIIKGSDTFTDINGNDNQRVDVYGLRVIDGSMGENGIKVSIENGGTIESGQYGLNFVGENSQITIDKIHNKQGGKI